MEAEERGGFQDDGGTDQPARAHEQRAHAGDEAISETEVGGPLAGAIEDQQLLLDENGLGHHGSGAARAGEPGDRRQQMEKQDSPIAHAPHRNKPPESLEILRNLEFAMHTCALCLRDGDFV